MDKYHMYEELGKGQFSQVFKGREKLTIEYVAMKRIDKALMKQVTNEVESIHRLKSHHVVKFYDWYETRNSVWLILEYCAGGSLQTLIEQDKFQPAAAVRLFGVDLVAGLQHIHAAGILHCDLTPGNVLIDEFGILKLTGFGHARRVPNKQLSSSAATAAIAQQHKGGSPHYRAAEMFLEDSVPSFAADFWSLGCVLYALSQGTPPFAGGSLREVIGRTLNEQPQGLQQLQGELQRLVTWLLQKDPIDRPEWSQLLQHSFWAGSAPTAVAMPQQPIFDAAVAAQRLATKHSATANANALSARTTAAAASSSSGSNSAQQQQQQQQRTPRRSDATAAVTPAAATTTTATKQRVSSADARNVSKGRKPGSSSSSSSSARRAHREADMHMHSSSSASDGDKDTELVRCSHNAVAETPSAAAVAAAAAVVRASAELHGTTEYEEDFELDDSFDNNTAAAAHSDDDDLAAAFAARFDRALSTSIAAATAGAAIEAQRSSPHTSSSAKQSARALNFEPITGERSASSRPGSSAKSRTSTAAAAAAATTATSALRASTAWSSEQRAATPDTDRSAAATTAVTAATLRPTDATGSRDADSADVLWIDHVAAQSGPAASAHSLLLHAADARVKPIVGNTDIEPAASAAPQFTAALLPFRALPSATVEAMSQQEAEQFLSSIYTALLECPTATRAHIAGYLITVAAAPATATLLVNSTFVPLFVKLLLGTQHQQQQQQQQQHSRTSSSKQQSAAASPQLKRRLTALLALTVRHASYIAADTILGTDSTDAVHDSGGSGSGSSSSSTGLLAAFVRLLDEKAESVAATDVLVRRKAVAALGELLFYMATQGGQPEGESDGIVTWNVPARAVAAVAQCLAADENPIVRHYAAKALENVLAQGGAQQVTNGRIVTLSTAQRLLALADTSTADSSTANSNNNSSSSSSSSSSATAAAALSHLLCHALLGGHCPLPSSSSDNNSRSSSSSTRTANAQGAVLVAAVVRDALPALLCGLNDSSPLRAQTAWLNILNLVLLHGSTSSNNSNSDTAKPQSAERRARPLARPLTPLTQLRAAQSLLLAHADELSRLAAAIASTGGSAVVRGKALLCIALLSTAQPSSLAGACKHGVLECLREALRALGPRLNTLSTQQQYQYQCCLQLASHCCQYTGTVLRRLAVQLHKLAPDNSTADSSSVSTAVTVGQRAVSASASCLPAVVAVLSSSAMNSTAVSAPVIEDLGTCLALAHRHVASATAGKRTAAAPQLLDALLNVAAALSRAPQRSVLPLAAAAVAQLVPALCTLLPHSCAETRTAALTVLSSLLPALLQQQLQASVSEAAAVAAVTTDHLLPHCAHLLADSSDIQQILVRLLLQTANCWSDAGAALVRRKVLPQLLPLLDHNSSDSAASVQCDVTRLLCVLVAAADQRAAVELLRLGLAETLADSIQQCSSSQAYTQLSVYCELVVALLQLALAVKAQARSPSVRRVTLQASQWTELLQPLVPALPALCKAVGDVVARGQSNKLSAVCEQCA
eukprot:20739-Heterococcus_DN1.PRE.3